MTAVLVLSAIAIAGSLVHREFFAERSVSSRSSSAPRAVFDSSWQSLVAAGIRVGRSDALVQIIEFADFECPYCRLFHESVESLPAPLAEQVSIVFIHSPLVQHRFALPAARAAECADSLGRFDEFAKAVFARQDSLGLRSWESFAADAGIADSVRIANCAKAPTHSRRIEEGVALAASINVRGTPTVFVNGWRFARPPTDSLAEVVARVAQGLPPFAELTSR